MPTTSILVTDRDRSSRAEASRELRLAGHRVSDTADLDTALSILNRASFDLLMIDMTSDPASALRLLRDIKSSRRMAPVRIVMTSGHARDVASVLRSGADDFVRKPYDPSELVARIERSLSRYPTRDTGESILQAGALRIDKTSHRITVNDQPLKVSPREYQLLVFFASNPNRVYRREELLELVWREARRLGVRTVDVHVRRLRRLLEPHGCNHYVETVRGAGYRFNADTVTQLSH